MITRSKRKKGTSKENGRQTTIANEQNILKLNYDEIDTLQFVHNGYNSLLYRMRMILTNWCCFVTDSLSQQLDPMNGRQSWLDMATYTYSNLRCMQRKSNFNTKSSLNNRIASSCGYFQSSPILFRQFFNENLFDTQKNAEHSKFIETRLCKLFI